MDLFLKDYKMKVFQLILLEPGKYGVLNAKNRGVENIIQGSLETINFNSNSISSSWNIRCIRAY